MKDSLAGHFLVASPYLTDPNFYRSVVFIVEHSVEGAFGLVVNRPTAVSAQAMWQQTMSSTTTVDAPVFDGGPIAGPIMVLHSAPTHSDLAVIDGVYFASERSKVVKLLEQPPTHLRIFSGYAGWAAGQLDQELTSGGWLTCPASGPELFDIATDQVWQLLTRSIGRGITAAVGRLRSPDNPSWN